MTGGKVALQDNFQDGWFSRINRCDGTSATCCARSPRHLVPASPKVPVLVLEWVQCTFGSTSRYLGTAAVAAAFQPSSAQSAVVDDLLQGWPSGPEPTVQCRGSRHLGDNRRPGTHHMPLALIVSGLFWVVTSSAGSRRRARCRPPHARLRPVISSRDGP
jgi:hypothetical protein